MLGVRIARKHLGWYAKGLAGGDAFRHEMNTLDTAAAQLAAVERFFDQLAAHGDRCSTSAQERAVASAS